MSVDIMELRRKWVSARVALFDNADRQPEFTRALTDTFLAENGSDLKQSAFSGGGNGFVGIATAFAVLHDFREVIIRPYSGSLAARQNTKDITRGFGRQ